MKCLNILKLDPKSRREKNVVHITAGKRHEHIAVEHVVKQVVVQHVIVVQYVVAEDPMLLLSMRLIEYVIAYVTVVHHVVAEHAVKYVIVVEHVVVEHVARHEGVTVKHVARLNGFYMTNCIVWDSMIAFK